jgi:oligoendopeptidase F
MRRVGIDLSSPQPIRDAVAYVGRLIDELEAGLASAAQAPGPAGTAHA